MVPGAGGGPAIRVNGVSTAPAGRYVPELRFPRKHEEGVSIGPESEHHSEIGPSLHRLAHKLACRRIPRRAALSLLVSTFFPSGLNATEPTGAGCSITLPTGRPLSASQRRAVWSSLPLSTVVPRGLNATAVTTSPCQQGGPSSLAQRQVPQAGRVSAASCQHRVARRTKLRLQNASGFVQRTADRPASGPTPKAATSYPCSS